MGIALLAAGCAAPAASGVANDLRPQASTGTVTGRVVHATSNEPVPDVAVVVQQADPRVETETDRDGRFLLLNVPRGSQVVVLVKAGWQTVQDQPATVLVAPNQNVALPTLRMAPL